jgi:hypothetical protein
MVSNGLLHSLMVSYDPFMVSYGLLWSHMTSYGLVWSVMVSYGL